MALTLTSDVFDRYSDGIKAITNEALTVFSKAFEGVDLSTLTDAQKRELKAYAADLMTTLVDTYGDATASVSCWFFEELTSEQGELVPATMTDTTTAERAKKSAHYWAQHLYGEKQDLGKFIAGCSAFIERRVSHTGDDSIIKSASMDARIAYARVPQGETCGFCTALAGRGFVYATEEEAGQGLGIYADKWHDHCDCKVIAGYRNLNEEGKQLEVEGYDYKAYFDEFDTARKAVKDTLWPEWKANEAELKDKYDTFNNYSFHRIVQQMNNTKYQQQKIN